MTIFATCSSRKKSFLNNFEPPSPEGIRPWTNRIVFGTQVIRKIYSVPLRFYSEPLMLSFEPHDLKTFEIFYDLKTNSVDYHDSMHFVPLCKFWNIAKFYNRLLSLKQGRPLMVWITYCCIKNPDRYEINKREKYDI